MASSFRILCPSSSRIDGDPSGLPVFLRDLVRAMPDVVFGVFYAEDDLLRLDIWIGESKTEYAWPATPTRLGGDKKKTRLNPFMDERGDTGVLDTVVELFHPTLMHVQHLLNQSRSIYRAAHAYSLPVVHTLHDFYSISSAIHIQAWPPSERELEDAVAEGMPTILQWRSGMETLLGQADLLTAPTQFVFDAIRRYFPLDADRCRVVPHSLSDATLSQRVVRSSREGGDAPLRIGVLGALKLDPTWQEALKRAPDEMEVHYFGHVPFIYDPEPGHRTTLHGVYPRDSIIPLLAAERLDLVVLPSPTLETFSYALSEAWAAGLPVLAPDQGALAERLAEGGGWLYPAKEPLSVARKLHALAEQPELIVEQMKVVSAKQFRPMSETTAIYREIWTRALKLHEIMPRKKKSEHWTEH